MSAQIGAILAGNAQLRAETARLREQLSIAVKALEEMAAQHCHRPQRVIAREALAQIKELEK